MKKWSLGNFVLSSTSTKVVSSIDGLKGDISLSSNKVMDEEILIGNANEEELVDYENSLVDRLSLPNVSNYFGKPTK